MTPTPLETISIPAVDQIIATYGKLVTFKNVLTYTANSITGEVTQTTENKDVKVTPPSPFSDMFTDDDETVVEVHGTKFLVAALNLDFDIDLAEEVVIDGETRTVIKVEAFYHGEAIGHYRVLCR